MPNGSVSRRNSLLRALLDDDRRMIEPYLDLVTLPRGLLLDVGQVVTHAYFPLDCVLSLTIGMRDGGAVETATIGCEGMDGYIVALGNHRTLVRTFVQVEGAAARLPVQRLEAAFVASPGVRELFLSYVQALMGHVTQLAACNALHTAEARLCRWLLMLRDRMGSDTFALTHETLAEMLGVQRPTVTLIARTIQAAGLIRYRRGVIEVLDWAALEDTSCECYGVVHDNYRRLLPLSFS